MFPALLKAVIGYDQTFSIEIIRIFDISPTTLHKWMNGTIHPHKDIQLRIIPLIQKWISMEKTYCSFWDDGIEREENTTGP